MKIVVVGGGAAGLMAAIAASESGADVTLVEKNEKLGKKIYITGKGRCNVTNDCDPEDFFANTNRNSKFMFSSYYGFTAQAMMELLEGGGLKLKTERGNRVFPESDHASDVTKTLEKIARSHGVNIELNTTVKEILTQNENPAEGEPLKEEKPTTEEKTPAEESRSPSSVIGVRCTKAGKRVDFLADKVIVATGGITYPSTGSTGDGYRFATETGHKVTKTMPSLVALNAHLPKEEFVRISDMSGLSLKNVSARILCNKKVIFEKFGEMLFTHTGVSGPIMITASSVIANLGERAFEGELTALIDLKPALTPEELDARLVREFDAAKNKNIKNVMRTLLPESLINAVLAQAQLDPEKKIHDITKEERKAILESLKSFEICIDGLRGYEEAIITKGGVSVKDINPSTMESKFVKGLYFAGEVLDVDAFTGGFNLQIAWSTGYAAGKSAAE